MYGGVSKNTKRKNAHAQAQQYSELAIQLRAASGQLSNPLVTYGSSAEANYPDRQTVRAIHVYDFDNTLFNTPHPNPDLFTASSISLLEMSHTIYGGGWWNDVNILESTGEGYETEVKRGWAGWWNEDLAELVKLSSQEDGALSILIANRSAEFGKLIGTMCDANGLKFDAVILRRMDSERDMQEFRLQFLMELLQYYSDTALLRLYDHRNKSKNRYINLFKKNARLNYEIVLVHLEQRYLDPLAERKAVQRLITSHNDAWAQKSIPSSIRNGNIDLLRDVRFSGYVLTEESRYRAFQVLNSIPEQQRPRSQGMILYCGRAVVRVYGSELPADMQRGAKVQWTVTHFGVLMRRIWALKLRCTDVDESKNRFQDQHPDQALLLASKKKVKFDEVALINDWEELDEPFEITTHVGECAWLKILARKKI